jgi:NAD-dependent deacetylase
VIELHGNIAEVRCTACGRVADHVTEALPPLPQCDDADCGGLLRPNVVWFGEPLPPGAWDAAERAARDADVLLVVGTSATVYPAAGLAHVGRGAVVEVNLERTPMSGSATLGLYGPAAQVLPKLVSAVGAGCARG